MDLALEGCCTWQSLQLQAASGGGSLLKTSLPPPTDGSRDSGLVMVGRASSAAGSRFEVRGVMVSWASFVVAFFGVGESLRARSTQSETCKLDGLGCD